DRARHRAGEDEPGGRKQRCNQALGQRELPAQRQDNGQCVRDSVADKAEDRIGASAAGAERGPRAARRDRSATPG
ncbi:MAG: hypothetical protein R3B07_37400, partial [Polyangiaceae bacterium]